MRRKETNFFSLRQEQLISIAHWTHCRYIYTWRRISIIHMVLHSQQADTDGKQITQEIYINQLFQKVFSITFFLLLYFSGLAGRARKNLTMKEYDNFSLS